jgi:hypothetical protein
VPASPRFACLIFLWFVGASSALATTTIDLIGPPGSGSFGEQVLVLGNGNTVVVDPGFDSQTHADVGAVYLYSSSLDLLAVLTGDGASDQIGSGGVEVLSNGHLVVVSPSWKGNCGAVTWIDASTGLDGVVSESNSLIGARSSDLVGAGGVVEVGNSNFVVLSPFLSDGSTIFVGAVTFSSGVNPVTGTVSDSNSLLGAVANDSVGLGGITVLANGHYVVSSPRWRNVDSGASSAGAVTWGDGSVGLVGRVSALNSLVGTSEGDEVGSAGIWPLIQGNYVVASDSWDDDQLQDVGAATWGPGAGGISGAVSRNNSLVGSTPGDAVGLFGVIPLSNGHYLVASPFWDRLATVNVGAVTWGNGNLGIVGSISSLNSLVGASESDFVGSNRAVALANGHFVVPAPFWDLDIAHPNAGAVAWGNGTVGSSGEIGLVNALTGSSTNDRVGDGGVFALTNGHYVVRSPLWNASGVADAGAVTWGDGAAGVVGSVSAENSLVGTSTGDFIDDGQVTVLSNGNYVVVNPDWDNGAVQNVGAVTWGDGSVGVSGIIAFDNSLLGRRSGDFVGAGGVTALANGDYVVSSPFWDSAGAVNLGAATWADGSLGLSGTISTANSLVGAMASDRVSLGGVYAMSDGSYVVSSPNWGAASEGAATWGSGPLGAVGTLGPVNSLVGSQANDQLSSGGVEVGPSGIQMIRSPLWDADGQSDAGAVSLGLPGSGVVGDVMAANSIIGLNAGSGSAMRVAYGDLYGTLAVGFPGENRVAVLRESRVSERLFEDGFESPPAVN